MEPTAELAGAEGYISPVCLVVERPYEGKLFTKQTHVCISGPRLRGLQGRARVLAMQGCTRLAELSLPPGACQKSSMWFQLPSSAVNIGIVTLRVLAGDQEGGNASESVLHTGHILVLPPDAASEARALFRRMTADIYEYFHSSAPPSEQAMPYSLLAALERWGAGLRVRWRSADAAAASCSQPQGPDAQAPQPMTCYAFEHYWVPFMQHWAATLELRGGGGAAGRGSGQALLDSGGGSAAQLERLAMARRCLDYLMENEMWSCIALLLGQAPQLREPLVRLGMEVPGGGERTLLAQLAAAPRVTPIAAAPRVTPIAAAPRVTPIVAAPRVTPIVAAPRVTPIVAAPRVTPIAAAPRVTPFVPSAGSAASSEHSLALGVEEARAALDAARRALASGDAAAASGGCAAAVAAASAAAAAARKLRLPISECGCSEEGIGPAHSKPPAACSAAAGTVGDAASASCDMAAQLRQHPPRPKARSPEPPPPQRASGGMPLWVCVAGFCDPLQERSFMVYKAHSSYTMDGAGFVMCVGMFVASSARTLHDNRAADAAAPAACYALVVLYAAAFFLPFGVLLVSAHKYLRRREALLVTSRVLSSLVALAAALLLPYDLAAPMPGGWAANGSLGGLLAHGCLVSALQQVRVLPAAGMALVLAVADTAQLVLRLQLGLCSALVRALAMRAVMLGVTVMAEVAARRRFLRAYGLTEPAVLPAAGRPHAKTA